MISKEIDNLLVHIENFEAPEYLYGSGSEQLFGAKITNSAAKYYEKLRWALDYKEEHLLRRSTIERILKRRVVFGRSTDGVGEELVSEMMQAGYLQNVEIPKVVIRRIQVIIEKNAYLTKAIKEFSPNVQKPMLFDSTVIGLAACEIEEVLFLPLIKEAAVNAFYEYINPYVKIRNSGISGPEKDKQVYIACHRGLLKSDDTQLFYKLWITRYSDWHKLDSVHYMNTLDEIAKEFSSVKVLLESQIDNHIQNKLVSKLKDDSIYFLSMLGVLEKYTSSSRGVLSDPKIASKEIRDFIEDKYNYEQERADKSSRRALFYIFFTKIILAFAVELPYDLFIVGKVHYVAIGTNVIFHPALLFFMTKNVVRSNAENTNKILKGVSNILYCGPRADININAKDKRSFVYYVAILLYSTFFIFSFGLIVWFLNKLNFNIMGIFLFIMFLTLVSFFGFRIRYNANLWKVREEDERFLSFVWDLLTLPIISLGRWLSQRFASINIFIFIMDFIIETPFKALLKVFDSFVAFLKEKKEEIR